VQITVSGAYGLLSNAWTSRSAAVTAILTGSEIAETHAIPFAEDQIKTLTGRLGSELWTPQK